MAGFPSDIDGFELFKNLRPVRIGKNTQITPHTMRGYDSADDYHFIGFHISCGKR